MGHPHSSGRRMECSLPCLTTSTASADRHARLLSTPDLTSELLRTQNEWLLPSQHLAVSAIRPQWFNLTIIWGLCPLVRILLLSDTDLSTPRLTPFKYISRFGVLSDLIGNLKPSHPISRSTSRYTIKRLHLNAFHGSTSHSEFGGLSPLPQLIGKLFQRLPSVLQLVRPNLPTGQG